MTKKSPIHFFARLLIQGKKRLAAAFAVGLVLLPAMGAAAQDFPTLTTAWEPWPPYQYLNADNRLTGLDVELLEAVAASAGYRMKFRKLPWERHMEHLKRGSVQVAAGISYTAKRAKFLFYSRPYRLETVRLYVRRGETGAMQLTSLADLIESPFVIGVQASYYYGPLYESLKGKARFLEHIEEIEAGDANFRKLILKRIDGVLSDTYVAAATLRSLGDTQKVEIHPMTIYSDRIYFVFSKKSVDPKIVEAFNRAIEKETLAGTLQEIIDKWLK
ncbi:substrate-binding periplasmic protein [Desulfosarcina widdelii]|nr:transporter substrate-binding domain-containing protein [Desulfosarcina widdelii]